ncbi:MAG: SdrD B-like domain-containing protein [Maricaulaceae bacterium]
MHGLEKANKNNFLACYLTVIALMAYFVMQTLLFTPVAFADTSVPSDDIVATKTSPVASETPESLEKEQGDEADEDLDPSVETIEKYANVVLSTKIEHSINIKLDGEDLQSGLVHRSDEDGLYFDAIPVFKALENTYVYNAEVGVFNFERSQDNAKFSIRMKDGLVAANGKPVGKLPHFGEISDGRILLTANALAFLTGTSAKYDKENRVFDFRLDPRLKIATGFNIFVEDVALQELNPEPRSVGSVLLLPLLPIAEELGHDVIILDGGTSVRVKRSQDSAIFTLNLDTGLVSLRERPFGLVEDAALIDRTNLLLPTNAIEALTGTHVEVVTGTNRINILLDDELKGGAIPDARVSDVLSETPFTPESVNFLLAPDRVNRLNFTFHKGHYNGRVRYEIEDLPSNAAELEPSWLSLDFRRSNGIYGSVGDYSSDLRELDGVDIRRIRGVSVVKETDKGNRWALAAGLPESGRRAISDNQTRSTFSGIAAGARFASKNGWEAGLAVHSDTLNKDHRAVLSAISGSLGRNHIKNVQWTARGDVGLFSGPTRERGIDARGAVSGRYNWKNTVSLDLGLDYQGVEFQRNTIIDREEREAEAELIDELNGDETVDVVENPVEDNQIIGQDVLSQRVGINYTPNIGSKVISDPTVSLRFSRTDNGLTSGRETGNVVDTKSLSVGTSFPQIGLSIGGNIIDNNVKFNDGTDSRQSRQYTVLASKSFDWVDLKAQYQKNQSNETDDVDQLVLTANFNVDRKFKLPLPKEGLFTVSPSVSAGQSNGRNSVRGGLVANYDSGNIFGKKNQVKASFGVLQSINDFSNGETSKFLTVTAAREINFGKNLSLGLSYRNNLKGNQRIGLELRGGYRLNEPRRYTKTHEGRGVLKGQAFLDKNYDGIRQPNEPGAGGVILRIKRSGLALRSDSQGYYTIQNIKEGLHSVAVDSRSLPLGFGLPDEKEFKATILEGHVSSLDIPIIQRGQLRGFTFIDEDEDGEYDKGETRVEGVKLSLVNKTDSVNTNATSSSFGQFAFDDLKPATYEILVAEKGGPGYEGGTRLEVELDAATFDLKKIAIALKPLREILTVDAGDENGEYPEPPPQQVTMSATP